MQCSVIRGHLTSTLGKCELFDSTNRLESPKCENASKPYKKDISTWKLASMMALSKVWLFHCDSNDNSFTWFGSFQPKILSIKSKYAASPPKNSSGCNSFRSAQRSNIAKIIFGVSGYPIDQASFFLKIWGCYLEKKLLIYHGTPHNSKHIKSLQKHVR